MTQNAASFEWHLEQEKAVQYVQTIVQAALPFELYDPADPMGLEVSLADRVAVWSLDKGELQRRHLGFGSKILLLSGTGGPSVYVLLLLVNG